MGIMVDIQDVRAQFAVTAAMVAELQKGEDDVEKGNFSYTPHITLKYIAPTDPMPVQRVEPTPVTFSKITLSVGGQRTDYELTGELQKGGPGSGPHPGSGSLTPKDHLELLQQMHDHVKNGSFENAEYVQHVASLSKGINDYRFRPDVKVSGKAHEAVEEGNLWMKQASEKKWYNADAALSKYHEALTNISSKAGSNWTGVKYDEDEIQKETGSKEGSWITVNGQHILVGADGQPIAGNTRVLGSKKVSDKVDRARKNAVLTGAYEQRIADNAEAKLSTAIGIPRTRDNSAFDLRNDDVGVEVKTMVTGHNDKITMGKTALGRKLAEQQADGIKAYTVVVDMRGGRSKAAYYVREGLGSFRVGSMTPVTLPKLKEMVHQ